MYSMITLIAQWVVPITSGIIRDGAVVIDKRKIIDLGPADRILKKYSSIRKDLGNSILMPALANCHTHLELSYLQGRMKARAGFVRWINSLINKRAKADDKEIFLAAKKALDEMYRSGVSFVGEISNSLIPMKQLADSRLRGIIFHEIFGLRREDALRRFAKALERKQTVGQIFKGKDNFAFSITAHAPHTVSPVLFKMLGQYQKMNDSILSVHCAESVDEMKLIKTGKSKLKDYLIEKNFWCDDWKVPGLTPVGYLAKLGALSSKLLAVHCIQVSKKDIEILTKKKVSVVVCPRSNQRLKTGKAPIRKFLDAGIRVALGTDSLASNSDLSIFNEMRFVRDEFRNLKPAEILQMGTIHGASALGMGTHYGSIERGKIAELIAIDMKGLKDQGDPLEILLSGINPARVSRPL